MNRQGAFSAVSKFDDHRQAHTQASVAKFLQLVRQAELKRAGKGAVLSTMALSLAACGGGGGETTATTTVPPATAPVPPDIFVLSAAQLAGLRNLATGLDAVSSFINSDVVAATTALNSAATPVTVETIDASARNVAQNTTNSLSTSSLIEQTRAAANALESLAKANQGAIETNFARILDLTPLQAANIVAEAAAEVANRLPRVSNLTVAQNEIFDIIVAAQNAAEVLERMAVLTSQRFPSLNLANNATYSGPTIPVNATLDQLIAIAQASVSAASTFSTQILTAINNGLSQGGAIFNLVDGNDVVVGTANNDQINATVVTLQAADSINGGAGNDTLTVNQLPTTPVVAADVTDALFTGVTNVETLVYESRSSASSGTVTLAAEAVEAGFRNLRITGNGGNADIQAFTGALTVTGNAGVNIISVNLASAGLKTLALGLETIVIDEVRVTPVANAAVGSVQVNFTSASVGNGTSNPVTIVGPNGNVVVEDEGVLLSAVGNANIFKVVGLDAAGVPDTAGQTRGDFAHVFIGTSGNDAFDASAAGRNLTGAVYLNAGSGDDTLVGSTGNDFFVGGAGNDRITLGQGGNDTVLAGDGNDLIIARGAATLNINAGAGDDRVDVTDLTGIDTINGGDGIDTLLTDAVAAANTLTNVSGFERLEITAATTVNLQNAPSFTEVGSSATSLNGLVQFTNATNAVTTLNLVDSQAAGNENNVSFLRANPSDVTALTINRTALSGVLQTVNVIDENSITYNSGNAMPFSMMSAPQTNRQELTVRDISSLTINGNAKTELRLSAETTNGPISITTVNASAFSDYVNNVNGTTTATTLSVDIATSNQNVTFTAGTNTGGTTVLSGTGNDVLNGSVGNDSLSGGRGNDNLVGGAGDDTLVGGEGADTINGGAGSDTYAAGAIVGSAEETILLQGLLGIVVGTPSAAGQIINLQTGTAVYRYDNIIVDPLLTGRVVDTLVNIENAIGSDGADVITGSTTANRLAGGLGNDTISAGDGNDTVAGGAGNDTITLGAGNDTLLLDSLTGADVIQDYSTASDTIQISQSVFSLLPAARVNTMLTIAEFTSSPTETGGTSLFSYNTTTGQLFYDANGPTTAGGTLIATFTGAPALDINEFMIVA